jgi:hypothetical protein
MVFSNGPFNLFTKLRDLGDLLPSNLGEVMHCMICFPTWVGIGLSLFDVIVLTDVSFTPFNIIMSNDGLWYYIILLDGATASGGNWLIHTLQEFLEKDGQ